MRRVRCTCIYIIVLKMDICMYIQHKCMFGMHVSLHKAIRNESCEVHIHAYICVEYGHVYVYGT